MARSPQPEQPTAPQLYLTTPEVADPAALATQLTELLAAAPIAALLLRLQAADERTLINRIKALAPLVQNAGAALLVGGHPEIVARAGADGAHLTGIDAFLAAAPGLRPDRIAGVGGLSTRHDAMLAAEEGADYVLFGEPDPSGDRPRFDAVIERVSWWAEVFETPCVGYAAAAEEVGPLAQAGADFIALGEWLWRHPDGPMAALRVAQQELGRQTDPGRDTAT